MSGKISQKVGATKNASQTKQINKAGKAKRNYARRNRRRRFIRSNVNTTRTLIGEVGQSQSVKFSKREVWFSHSFAQGNALATKKVKFDTTTGPAWFKQMAAMYEKFKIHGVNLYIKFGGSAMTKGIYVLTYNANESAYATNKTFEQLSCQKGSKLIPAARQSGALHINGSSLTGYSTSLPTEGNNYCFDAIVAGIPVEAVDFVVEVQYVVTFYNPTINAN